MKNIGATYAFTPAYTGLTDLGTAIGDWKVSISEENTDYIPIGDNLYELKKYYNGWHNGDLIVIGGRHGAGKTSLILDILKSTSIENNTPALYISPQGTSRSILLRLLKKYCDRYGNDSQETLLYIADDLNLTQCPLYIDDTPRQDITRLSAVIQEWMETYGIRLVTIDPFQCITESTYFTNNPKQGFNLITRELKSIARELDIPILVTSGLDNYLNNHKTYNTPTLDDLTLTGTTVYDADLIILIHNPQQCTGESEYCTPSEHFLIIPKNRHGPTGTFHLIFNPRTLSFHPMSLPPEVIPEHPSNDDTF